MIKNCKFFLIIILVGLLYGCASPKKIAGLQPHSTDGSFIFSGSINNDTYDAIIATLNQFPNQEIIITVNSNGGYIDGILEAMDAIRDHGQVTWTVPNYNQCLSACAVLGMAAHNINGILGFHSTYTKYRSQSFKLLGNNEEIKSRLVSYGYDSSLVNQMFQSVNIFRSIEFKNGKIINIF